MMSPEDKITYGGVIVWAVTQIAFWLEQLTPLLNGLIVLMTFLMVFHKTWHTFKKEP